MNENVIECAIEWLRGDKEATVTAYNASKLKNRVTKLAEEYPDDFKVLYTNDDGSIMAHIPVSCIRIARPTQMSDERKQELAERMRGIRKHDDDTE